MRRLDLMVVPFSLMASLVCSTPAMGLERRWAPIVDGRVANTSELYGTVAIVLTEDNSPSCTGTLIAPRVVATAAHCVVEQEEEGEAIIRNFAPSELLVVAGVVDVSEASDAQAYALSKIVVHPDYPNLDNASNDPSGAGRYDDVALLVLEREVTTLTPVAIPTIDEVADRLVSGALVTISGYGTINAEGDGGGLLYIAETPFDSRVDVELVLGKAGEPDTCPGDSGGPAYLVLGGKAELVGITSRSAEDATVTCGERGVYAFAPAYRDWLASSSDGLYDPGAAIGPGEPETPDEPDDSCDPDTEDCGDSCDPDTEDCGEACDPSTEDCETCEGEDCEEDEEDEGCGGGALPSPFALVFLALRRRVLKG